MDILSAVRQLWAHTVWADTVLRGALQRARRAENASSYWMNEPRFCSL